MWGFHDRQLILRKLLFDVLTKGSAAEAFRRRWRYQQTAVHRECGLVLNEDEWAEDWKFLIRLSSDRPRNAAEQRRPSTASVNRYERSFAGQSQESEPIYESLEEMHVFVLAHVLRRPIVVIAKTVLQDVNGDALAPIPFGGIYLPLEWDCRHCHSSPLLLTYDLSHFCALVSMESPEGGGALAGGHLADAIPLVSPQLDLLPIHFAVDPGENYDFSRNLNLSLSQEERMNLLCDYFVVKQVPVPHLSRDAEGFLEAASGAFGAGTGGPQKLELTKSDSEESGGSGKDRNVGDDFDRRTMPKPMKFITKSFDTIGSKLKNMAKINKMGGKPERKGSVGMATQSTRTSSLTVQMLEGQNCIICAKLRRRKTGYQDQLVGNYLAMMKEKFSEQQAQRQRQNEQIKSLSVEKARNGATGGERFSGLQEDGWQARNQKENRISLTDKSFARQNTMVVAGKSKFYTTAVEDQCPTAAATDELPKYDGLLTGNVESKPRRYNKIDTMSLYLAQEKPDMLPYGSAKPSANEGPASKTWETLPRLGSKAGGLDSAGTTSDLTGTNPKSRRLASDRFSADPSCFQSNYPSPHDPGDKLPIKRAPGNLPSTAGVSSKDPVHLVDIKSSSSADPQKAIHCKEAAGKFGDGREGRTPESGIRVHPADQQLCQTDGCHFYGSSSTDFFCSKCFREKSSPQCLTPNCPLQGDPTQGSLCSLCYQKKCYNSRVQYPTAVTKF